VSVDVSGLISLIDDYCLQKWECVGQAFVEVCRSNEPVATGRMSAGTQATGASGGGGLVTNQVDVIAYSDAGFYYPAVQNEGDGGVTGKLMHPTEGALAGLFFMSRVGVPATNFWQNTLSAWGEILGQCAG
jgi:hypothetical protein